MPNRDYLDRLERAKRDNVPQLLFRAARLLNDRALAQLAERPGRPRLRAAHTQLFPHLEFDGIRLTELAARVGTSKQAVAQLVDDLERMGAVERVPDPSDGRAKLIRFSRLGQRALLDGLEHLKRIEAELAEAMGLRAMAGLRRGLTALLAQLEPDADRP